MSAVQKTRALIFAYVDAIKQIRRSTPLLDALDHPTDINNLAWRLREDTLGTVHATWKAMRGDP